MAIPLVTAGLIVVGMLVLSGNLSKGTDYVSDMVGNGTKWLEQTIGGVADKRILGGMKMGIACLGSSKVSKQDPQICLVTLGMAYVLPYARVENAWMFLGPAVAFAKNYNQRPFQALAALAVLSYAQVRAQEILTTPSVIERDKMDAVAYYNLRGTRPAIILGSGPGEIQSVVYFVKRNHAPAKCGVSEHQDPRNQTDTQGLCVQGSLIEDGGTCQQLEDVCRCWSVKLLTGSADYHRLDVTGGAVVLKDHESIFNCRFPCKYTHMTSSMEYTVEINPPKHIFVAELTYQKNSTMGGSWKSIMEEDVGCFVEYRYTKGANVVASTNTWNPRGDLRGHRAHFHLDKIKDSAGAKGTVSTDWVDLNVTVTWIDEAFLGFLRLGGWYPPALLTLTPSSVKNMVEYMYSSLQ